MTTIHINFGDNDLDTICVQTYDKDASKILTLITDCLTKASIPYWRDTLADVNKDEFVMTLKQHSLIKEPVIVVEDRIIVGDDSPSAEQNMCQDVKENEIDEIEVSQESKDDSEKIQKISFETHLKQYLSVAKNNWPTPRKPTVKKSFPPREPGTKIGGNGCKCDGNTCERPKFKYNMCKYHMSKWKRQNPWLIAPGRY